MKKSKLATPAWILEGFDSEADYNKKKGIVKKNKNEKTFKIRECPKCKSDEIGVVLSNSDAGLESEIPSDLDEEEQIKEGRVIEWECRKCKWKGKKPVEKELGEEELMKYLDEKEEEVA